MKVTELKVTKKVEGRLEIDLGDLQEKHLQPEPLGGMCNSRT